MKSLPSYTFLLITLSFLVSLSFLQRHVINGDGNNLIKEICQYSEDENLCYTTYDNQQSGLRGLAMIGLNKASENATAIIKYISRKITREPNLEPTVEQGLVDCMHLYEDTVDQVDDSIAALEADAFRDVRIWVDAAISDAVSCQEVFIKKPNADAELVLNNEIFIKLCNNVLAVNKLLASFK